MLNRGIPMAKIKIKKSVAVTLSLALGVAVIIFVAMLLLNVSDYGITIASFGATIFMILSKKDIPKKLIFGSYLAAGIAGFAFSNLSEITSLNVALAAVSSIIIMTVLGLQHPPAIGIAAALVLNKFQFWTDLLILAYIFFILGLTLFLKGFIQNPLKAIKFVEIEKDRIKWNFRKKEIPKYLQLKGSAEE